MSGTVLARERQGADKKRFTLKALLYGGDAHFIHLVKAQERRECTASVMQRPLAIKAVMAEESVQPVP